MPGIAGIIRKSPYDGIERDLSLMVEAMRHEAFYHGGQYMNKDLGLYLGWMGHRGEFCDCMPLFNPTRDILMIFHGQNYLLRDADLHDYQGALEGNGTCARH